MASSVRKGAFVAVLALLLWAPLAKAETVFTGSKGTLTIKGFISATAFLQNQSFTFGNGQNAEFPNPPELSEDRWFLSGDVRNTRLTLAFDGPEVENAPKFGGGIEIDFFGGFNGTGAFSDEQETPRLRLAWVDVKKGRTTYRMGQYWSPLFGNVPASLTARRLPARLRRGRRHRLALPRRVHLPRPGQGRRQDQDQVHLRGHARLVERTGRQPELALRRRGQQHAADRGPLRLVAARRGSGDWGLYVVGHWDEKDLSGVGVTAPDDSLTGTAFEVGAKVERRRLLDPGQRLQRHRDRPAVRADHPVRRHQQRRRLGPGSGSSSTRLGRLPVLRLRGSRRQGRDAPPGSRG